MNKFANMKIGQQLGLVLGAAILLVGCLTILAIRSIHRIDDAKLEADRGNRMMVLAERVAADAVRVCESVASLVLSGRQSAEQDRQVEALRKRYLEAMNEFQSLSRSDEGKRLLADLAQALIPMRDLNNKVMDLSEAGKRSEAVNLYSATAGRGMGRAGIPYPLP
jgi:methyl-accepting chemotaxis protein